MTDDTFVPDYSTAIQKMLTAAKLYGGKDFCPVRLVLPKLVYEEILDSRETDKRFIHNNQEYTGLWYVHGNNLVELTGE